MDLLNEQSHINHEILKFNRIVSNYCSLIDIFKLRTFNHVDYL